MYPDSMNYPCLTVKTAPKFN
ncbi:Protein of unknown function [Thermobacillus xylanilyticus]|uniref:Uncharacterized protein n=1 Tax=Thermobacillus xylanilyticus TaxID=76633 RepID=A0ABN7RI59_THEXY|nr:Protein of unknown function [Thermobacillus xylanilyticus]